MLVHGAFSDASSWSGVVVELQSAGIPVLAPPNGDGSGRFVCEVGAAPDPDGHGPPSDAVMDAAEKLTAYEKVLTFLRANAGVTYSLSDLRGKGLGTVSHHRSILNALADGDEPVVIVKQPDANGNGARWMYDRSD